jgi:pimeloyl-ACP methyl ester carboxylesterase
MRRGCIVGPIVVAIASAAAQAQTARVNVGDAEIRYELSGQGNTIVFIHGWAQDLGIWDDQVAAFSSRYRVLRYDRRGYGKSTGHADPTADPDDLRILLDSLGIRSAIVLGLSGGSRAALDFAVAFPDRVQALVLYGQGPPEGFQPMPPGPRPREMFAEIARKHGLDSLHQFVRSVLSWEPPNRPDHRERLNQIWSRYEGRDLLDPRPPSGRVQQARMDQVGQIRVPTLVIVGDHERPLQRKVADTLTRRIPNARQVVITDGGHGAHFAQPERFNAALMDFLRTVYDPKAGARP